MTPAAIADALGAARRDGAGYVALCPCHDDTHPSLALHLGDDGRLLWRCRAGCPQDAVRDALAARGLLDGREHVSVPRRAPRPATAPARAPAPVPRLQLEPDMRDTRMGAPSDSWCYRSAEGMPLYCVARYQTAAGKAIRPWTWDGSRWVQRAYPAPRPLYGLDRLAALPDAPVLIAEGEKCADAAHVALGAECVCMTWCGGAGAVGKSDWTPLRGRRVLIWPDRDDPGRRAAEDIRRVLPGADVLDVGDGTDGWDVADLLDADGDEAVRRYVPECARVPRDAGGMSGASEPAGDWTAEIPPPEGASEVREIRTADGWPIPQPLTGRVPPEPYPIDALPATIRAAVGEVAGFVRAPVPLVASSALGALSVAAQAYVDVRRAERLEGPCGLYLLTIADSGERKTTCDGFFGRALRDYEQQQREALAPALARSRAELDAWTARRDGLLAAIRDAARRGKPTERQQAELAEFQQHRPELTRVPRLLYADATPEALAHGLAHHWPAAGVVSAEAGIVFGAHAMGKDSVMRNLALLNVLWDGGSLTIDRRTSESYTVRGARLTVALPRLPLFEGKRAVK